MLIFVEDCLFLIFIFFVSFFNVFENVKSVVVIESGIISVVNELSKKFVLFVMDIVIIILDEGDLVEVVIFVNECGLIWVVIFLFWNYRN